MHGTGGQLCGDACAVEEIEHRGLMEKRSRTFLGGEIKSARNDLLDVKWPG